VLALIVEADKLVIFSLVADNEVTLIVSAVTFFNIVSQLI
jgi:hypothetical protein